MTKQRARNNPITRDVNAAYRVQQAIELRKQRLTYQQIAELCGYGTPQSAHKAIMREMQRCIVEDVSSYRQQELDILDKIHQEVWKVAFDTKDKKDEVKTNLWAVDRLLEISKDRRKLLNLDVKPEEVNASMVVVREVPPHYLGSPSACANGS